MMASTTRDFRERLLRRAKSADVGISPAVVEQLETYYRLLTRWNTRINLTALALDELSVQALDRLLIEPLAAARYVPDSAITWFDLGSGGGSPALPLKVVRRAAQLTMVEAKARKAAFLREAVRTLDLPGAEVENARFEAVAADAAHRRRAGLVTVRAVRLTPALIDAAATLLAPGGQLFLFASDPPKALRIAHFSLDQTVQLGGSLPSHLSILRRL